MNGFWKNKKGITLIVLSEVGEIEEKIKLHGLNEGENEKLTGKLSKNNKEKIEMIKDKLPVCYDGIKEYNKIQNYSFDNGLDGMETRMTKGNVTEVINENGNNYLHIEMYLSSGNTQWVRVGNSKIANKYGDKCYAFIKYRNESIPSEDGFVLNNDIITLSRFGRGYDQILLNKSNFIKSYNLGWAYVSTVRKIESNTSNLGLVFSLGGGPGNGQKQEYSIDFDDIYIINLTDVFGEGSEPQKQELDVIFSNF